jgi:hypothetical protein
MAHRMAAGPPSSSRIREPVIAALRQIEALVCNHWRYHSILAATFSPPLRKAINKFPYNSMATPVFFKPYQLLTMHYWYNNNYNNQIPTCRDLKLIPILKPENTIFLLNDLL